MAYRLGVDLGTTYTAAAVARDGRAEVVPLGDRAADVPSVLFLREDGDFLVGDDAVRRGRADPGRLAREFKRRLGDQTSLLLGTSPFPPAALMARLLRWAVEATAERQGARPDAVTVTHPANWGPYRRELLEQAVRTAGIPDAELCPEPTAAVLHFATQERVELGDVVCVYDLGGGTFDSAVLRKTAAGLELLGSAEGIEHLGGVDFDAAVVEHVTSAVGPALDDMDPDDPATLLALNRLHDDCVLAKEALSRDTEVSIPVALGALHTSVRLTRGEFEDMLRPALLETIGCLHRSLDSASVPPAGLSAVVLVGGSARIPLVAQLLAGELGRPVALSPQPKHCVALGAALYASRLPPPPSRVAGMGRQPGPDRTGVPAAGDGRPVRPVAGSGTRGAGSQGGGAGGGTAVRALVGGSGSARLAGLPRLQRVPVGFGPAAAGLLALAAVLAMAVPGASVKATPGASWARVAGGADLATAPVVKADLSRPLPLKIAAGASARAEVAVTVGGLPLAQDSAILPGTELNVSSARLAVAGPVKAHLSLTTAGRPVQQAELLLVPTGRPWYATIPGAGIVVLVLFCAAYAESILRQVRRRRRARVSDIAGMALVGSIAGVALDLASWAIGKHLLLPVTVVLVVLLAAAAGGCLPLAVARRLQARAE